MFIYLIVNHATGKYYVGQHKGTDLKRYFQKKLSSARHARGSSHLFNSMRKHPLPCDWSIHALLSDVQTRAELDQYERDFIAFLKSQDPEYGYNIARGGEGGGMLGHKQSPETKEKIRAANEGRQLYPRTPENEAKRTANWQQTLDASGGSFHAPDTAAKIKDARAQQDESYRIARLTEWNKSSDGVEARARAAQNHRGKKHNMSAGGRAAISNAFKQSCHKRWHVGRGVVSPNCGLCAS